MATEEPNRFGPCSIVCDSVTPLCFLINFCYFCFTFDLWGFLCFLLLCFSLLLLSPKSISGVDDTPKSRSQKLFRKLVLEFYCMAFCLLALASSLCYKMIAALICRKVGMLGQNVHLPQNIFVLLA